MSGVTPAEIETLFQPLAGYDSLGLAVSGGPDSLALMILAARWAAQPGRPKLFVYTVDHALRPEAADEAAMVVREAGRLGLIARSLRWDGQKPATSVQAAARAARYRLIAAAMEADRVPLLLTAHHLADQAETVLMRMAHGSGVTGLRGMDTLSFVEGCEIYRPLLGVDPQRLRALVMEAGLTPAADPGNDDPSYERVRWRHMLPQLAAMGLTPERLAILAGRLGDATALVADQVEQNWPSIVIPESNGRFEVNQGRLGVLNRLVGVAMLGQLLELCSGDRRAPPLAALESLFSRLSAHQLLKPETLHGCIISADGDVVTVREEGPRRGPRSLRKAERAH
ncbi:MAG: tRNA lysidine(34) synthetase TilS [Devosia sp.]